MKFWQRLFGTSKPTPPAESVVETDPVVRAKGWTVESVAADPYAIDIYDRRGREFCTARRTVLEPALLQRAATADPNLRLYIGRLLLEMGAPSGGPLVLTSLTAASAETRKSALVALAVLRWEDGKGIQVPIDHAATAAAVRPFLKDKDAHLRGLAVQAFLRLERPEIAAEQRALLQSEDETLREKAVYHFATYHGDAIAWPMIKARFAAVAHNDFHGRYWAVLALGGFARNPDPALRAEVAAFAREELRAILNRDDNEAANEASNLMRAIGALAPPWEADALQEVLASKLTWARGSALHGLVKLEGASAAPRILAALHDPALQPTALTVIADRGAVFAGPELAERLRALLRDTRAAAPLEAAVNALVAIGHANDPAIAAVVDRLEPLTRFEVVTRAKGVDADQMIDCLAKAALLPTPDNVDRDAFRRAWVGPHASRAVFELLETRGRLHIFDAENDQVPPDYAELVGQLAALARGDFTIGTARLIKGGRGYTLHLSLAGQDGRIELEDRGDWFDVEALLDGLNKMLANTATSLRYVTLHTGDQMAYVVLGDAKGIANLAADVAFPLGDPAAARRIGEDFERRVIESLKARRDPT
jgi:hypothetical protein